MSQQTASAPNYFAGISSASDLDSVAGETKRKAHGSAVLAVGVLSVLALASTIQAIVAPELLARIFEQL